MHKFKIHILFTLFIFCCGFTTISEEHPLKMTFSKLELHNNEAILTTRFFLDDLSDLISKNYRLKEVDFTKGNSPAVKALQDYINHAVYVTTANSTISTFTITNIKPVENNQVLQVTSSIPQQNINPKDLKLTNSLFFGIFPNQVNVVKYNGKDYRFNIRQKQLLLKN